MRYHTSLRGALASGLVLSSAAFAAAQQQPVDAAAPREQTPRTERRTDDRTEAADQIRGNQTDEVRLTDYFADQLMLANQSEIELSQIAAKKSSNQEVKQFAEKLIQEHQQLDEKLKQLAPDAAARFADRRRAGGRLVDRLADRLDAERTADRPAADRTAADRPAADRPAQIRTAARDAAAHDALTKLCMINHKACENHRQMSKQMLESYQGQDFDMAFLGMQIGQHAWLLSELKALDGVGTPEFQEVVVQARQNVEQHLQHAKTLSKKLEDDRRAPRDS